MGVETALQAALYTRLAAASLGATGVHERGPQAVDGGDATAFPYVQIGVIVVTEMDTKNRTGFAAQVRLHTWGRSTMTEVKAIQGAIWTALHRAELTIAGFRNFVLVREDSDCTPAEDGRVHGVCEYRALIESA